MNTDCLSELIIIPVSNIEIVAFSFQNKKSSQSFPGGGTGRNENLISELVERLFSNYFVCLHWEVGLSKLI